MSVPWNIRSTPSPGRRLCRHFVFGALCALLLAATPALQGATRVLEPAGTHYGKTYAQWAAAWWQWALAIPAAQNPLDDSTGQHAANGQSGPVWFLAGTTGGNAERTVTVPFGKPLFFPLFNNIWLQTPADPPIAPECAAQDYNCLRDLIRPASDGATLSCTIDEVAVPNPTSYRVDSTVFTVTAPADNVFASFGLGGGTFTPCVDNGYYLMLAPLDPGSHTIHFSAANADQSFSLDIVYHITIAPTPPDLARLVVVGDSLMAGYRDGGLADRYQRESVAAQIARQAGVPLAQPLIAWPGIPNVLELVSMGPPPVLQPVPGTSTGRVDMMLQASNLAVPGHTVADTLRQRPDLPVDSMTDLVLGLPGLLSGIARSQIEWAEALQPSTVLVWAGNNDALNAAVVCDPIALTPPANFAADYAELLDRLAATGARLVVASIPDVTSIPFVQPATNIAALLGVPFPVFSQVLGVTDTDWLNLDGLGDVEAILKGQKPGPLGGHRILTVAEIDAIRLATAGFNATIATEAAKRGAVVVDTHAFLTRLNAEGGDAGQRHLHAGLFGGIFGLDGIHPTAEGAALTANEFIRALNAAGSAIPLRIWLEVRASQGEVILRWTDVGTGLQLETAENPGASSWTVVTTLPADSTELRLAATAGQGFFRIRRP